MIYKTISSKAIIGSALRKFGIEGSNIELDALEWIGDAIERIGVHVGFQNKLTCVDIGFFKIEKPYDLYMLNYILYNGEKLLHGRKPSLKRMHFAEDPYAMELGIALESRKQLLEDIEDWNGDWCYLEIREEQNIQLQQLTKTINELDKYVHSSNNYCRQKEYYLDEGYNCYKLSVESGKVFISYKAFPLDEEGYPVIIDEVKYRDAVEWYILRCALGRGLKHSVFSYEYVAAMSDKYIAQAINEHRKMTYEQMDQFSKNWTNLLYQIHPENENPYSN